jgi:DNA-binding response OmpR family regulator
MYGSTRARPIDGHGPHVMVVAHDPDLLDLLIVPLDLAGYRVRPASDGAEALALMAEPRLSFDLIIVDAGIPDLETLARGRLFRPAERPPILCLTSCDHLDRIVPELGFRVEDYVTKPCRITEVLARSEVLLRDRQGGRRDSTHSHGDLRLDDAACRAWRGARPLDLTPAEYRLLRYLLVNAEQVLSKEQLARHLWGESRGDNAIERLVSRLRHKVGPALIHTRRGFGYSLGAGHPSPVAG